MSWVMKIKQNFLGLLSALLVLGATSPAYAYCTCCMCVCPYICCNLGTTYSYIQNAFSQYRSNFIMNSYYKNQFEKQGLMPMADSLRDQIITSAMMIGAFLDGTSTNAALANMQSLNANAMRDYQVSDSICKFGTLSRSLAATEAKASTQQLVMSEIGLARNLGTQFSSAATGRGRDNNSRLYSFVAYYCDTRDNNRGLSSICKALDSIRWFREMSSIIGMWILPAPLMIRKRSISILQTIL